MPVDVLSDAASVPSATPAATPPPATPPPAASPRQSARDTLLAGAIVRTLATALPPGAPLVLVLDHGEAPGAPPLPGVPAGGARIRFHGPAAVARLLPPTERALADAYLRGDIDIDGDVVTAIETARAIDLRRLARDDARRLVRWSLELRRSGAGEHVRPLARGEARLAGARHSRARDLEAIRFHYDVGEAFYDVWLDRLLTYSCAYFERDDDPARDLEAAQVAKLDLVCRKLDLRPGQRLLDIGCGWGSLLLHAAPRYGVEAVGVTLSERQADEANRRSALMGLDHRVRAEVRDYRDLGELGRFDAVASVGMVEHVGSAMLPEYFGAAYAALVPGGRFLNHGIATAERGRSPRRPRGRTPRGVRRPASFVERYVFPDGELVPLEQAIAVARDGTGFEVLHVQSLRPHYALTLRAWVQRLEEGWATAVEAAGEEVARTWRLYMAGVRTGFEHGDLDVLQLLLARPAGEQQPASRPLRPWW